MPPCSPLKINWHIPLKCQLTFSRLYGGIFKTIGIFITICARTSNRIKRKNVYPRLEYICFQNELFCNLCDVYLLPVYSRAITVYFHSISLNTTDLNHIYKIPLKYTQFFSFSNFLYSPIVARLCHYSYNVSFKSWMNTLHIFIQILFHCFLIE
jgi:hypothetical protein